MDCLVMFRFDRVKFKSVLVIPELEIPSGKLSLITGPSGSGKSTLLKCLNKLYSPTEGRIFYKGEDLASLETVAHRRKVVMVPQNPSSLGETVREVLTAGFRYRDEPEPQTERLSEIMERFALSVKLDQLSHTLSGGELQRLALARAMLLESEVLLLDEPSSALDESAAHHLFAWLDEMVTQHHKTVVAVTHATRTAERFAHHRIKLSRGQVSSQKEGQ
jgi:putative ABC transport system ATP-binding protein